MILTTQHLMKTYGAKIAVNDVNLAIPRGSFTAILGANGAGKSTTMQLLTGHLEPTAGTINYQPHRRLGLVFQASVLDATLTVLENLQIRAQQYRHDARPQVAKLIEQLGLATFKQQRYGTLSGGQKRRVDIARALLNQPDILFLDEPTTGLDLQTRTAIWTLLQRLQREQQLTIVLTTHYLTEADNADQVYIIDHGQVIATGTAVAIKQQYAGNQLTLTTSRPAELEAKLTPYHSRCQASTLQLTVPTAQTAIQILTDHAAEISDFEFRPGTLDDAFLALTGREVR
ncbi:ABC transporter ATP-binding protein [Lactiplantibacillus daowaiensis]|uniref:ABC transporter ATP-binding protein n=1 Tax=Lactiplantibacillus daowaiensis TaxID=2559918 RepID=A0ABW1RYU7_9LACO|nr:ABC transporter ATP-binding protein [Lactiplantibacillus daowaiensis]